MVRGVKKELNNGEKSEEISGVLKYGKEGLESMEIYISTSG